VKYKFKNVQEEGYKILEDGHTMFPEDVRKRLNRLEYVEEENKKLEKNIRNSQIENANFKEILEHLLNYVPYDNLIDYFDEHELDVINKLQQD